MAYFTDGDLREEFLAQLCSPGPLWGGGGRTGYPYLGGMGSQAQGRDNGRDEQGLGEVFTKKRQE